jgi:ElaB/YqjD/DUF883 family membrane-anchored ribosome-binding protein
MSNTPAFPKDMPHVGLIHGDIDSDLSTGHGNSRESGLLAEVQNTRQQLGEKTAELTDKLRELPANAKQVAATKLGDYQAKFERSIEEANDRIKTQPVKSVLIAFGVGFLVGLTAMRR